MKLTFFYKIQIGEYFLEYLGNGNSVCYGIKRTLSTYDEVLVYNMDGCLRNPDDLCKMCSGYILDDVYYYVLDNKEIELLMMEII